MNAFDSTVNGVNDLNSQMKAAALIDEWDTFQRLEQERQSILRMLRYDNYREIITVNHFARSVEALLASNSELLAIVEECHEQTANHLRLVKKSRTAVNAYRQV